MEVVQNTYVGLSGIRKVFPGGVVAVDDLDLEMTPGEFLTILGPSGSGKTTVLRLIAGFETPTRGEIHLGDREVSDVPTHARGLGMVAQHYALFPHMNVEENLLFGLSMHRDMENAADRVVEALEMVELAGYGARMPHQLSGGQQQRVALARALIARPKVLLLDEPFGALDKKLRDQLQIDIRRLQRELGITTLFVTHDQDEALSMSDRIAVMNLGRLEQIATPREVYEEPATEFVSTFIGSMNMIPCRVVGEDGPAVTVEIGGRQLGARRTTEGLDGLIARLAVRPEHIRLRNRGESQYEVVATCQELTYLGNTTRLLADIEGSGPCTVAVATDELLQRNISPGSELYLEFPEQRLRVFPSQAPRGQVDAEPGGKAKATSDFRPSAGAEQISP